MKKGIILLIYNHGQNDLDFLVLKDKNDNIYFPNDLYKDEESSDDLIYHIIKQQTGVDLNEIDIGKNIMPLPSIKLNQNIFDSIPSDITYEVWEYLIYDWDQFFTHNKYKIPVFWYSKEKILKEIKSEDMKNIVISNFQD